MDVPGKVLANDNNLCAIINNSGLCDEAINLDVDLVKGEQVCQSMQSCELKD